ncbi:hypothetical protein A2U01_0071717, partial [Trifolium medium]|nr:hypothetical protein [Trifolium medium]
MLEPNGEDVDAPNGCDEELAPNEGDEPNGFDEELAPNGDWDGPKIDDAAADVEEPYADELKEGAEVPNPEVNVEVFGANGLLEL